MLIDQAVVYAVQYVAYKISISKFKTADALEKKNSHFILLITTSPLLNRESPL